MKAGVVFNDKYNVPYRRGRKEGRKGKNSLANDIDRMGREGHREGCESGMDDKSSLEIQ